MAKNKTTFETPAEATRGHPLVRRNMTKIKDNEEEKTGQGKRGKRKQKKEKKERK